MNYSTKLKDPRWQRRRLEILNRDEFMCQFCQSEDKALNDILELFLTDKAAYDLVHIESMRRYHEKRNLNPIDFPY